MSSALSATERAKQINEKHPGGFSLVVDADHWAGVGVYTGEDLDRYLAVCDYENSYKEIHGIKPRWENLDDLATEQIEMKTLRLYAEAASQEREPTPPPKGDATPLTHNPFAALLKRGGSS